MMSTLNDILNGIVDLFTWWVVIAPWENAIRVRKGKNIVVLQPGLHLRIPGLDRIFVQSLRKRYMSTPTQTVTTKDGKTVTVSGGTAYVIRDIGKLYDTLHAPEDVIQTETMALIARYVASHDSTECNTNDIEGYVKANLHLERYGLGEVEFYITDFVSVKTYRLINSSPKDFGNYSLDTNYDSKGRN